jgi:hypothetical protein
MEALEAFELLVSQLSKKAQKEHGALIEMVKQGLGAKLIDHRGLHWAERRKTEKRFLVEGSGSRYQATFDEVMDLVKGPKHRLYNALSQGNGTASFVRGDSLIVIRRLKPTEGFVTATPRRLQQLKATTTPVKKKRARGYHAEGGEA